MQDACGGACGRSCQQLVPCDVAGLEQCAWCCDTNVTEDRHVRGQIWREAKLVVVTRVATVFLDSPCVRALRRDEEASAVFVKLVKTTSAPQERIARSCDLSTNTSRTVKKALMLKSPPMKSTWCCTM